MRVVFTDAAEVDLEEIGDWIASDSPMRAVSYVRELRTACKQLGNSPNAFRRVPSYESFGVRQRAYDDYLIFYSVGKRVEVLRILHGARDYIRLLFPEE